MTISDIDALNCDEAKRLSPQEIDPIDEEAQTPAVLPAKATTAEPRNPRHPLVDTTPFGSEPALPVSAEGQVDADDATLFGLLWPLGEIVKLDATVERRVLRQQCERLSALGYVFEPRSQDWHQAKA